MLFGCGGFSGKKFPPAEIVSLFPRRFQAGRRRLKRPGRFTVQFPARPQRGATRGVE
jgi:hypothetical protein